ncbi:DUF2461 domain-containing protein [Reichenbachiella versicolor]|uniref:DUF2461 domain-containing protein n=1 Tax=Reichenbachiella versicolor TaxID=1821036 RepID=UPI000D6DC8FF|nr:DUF2461 domain-containing protein [Reichenbachiella versicolor]
MANLDIAYSFLKKLSSNNNREWFNDHKSEYLEAQEQMIEFADELLSEMKQVDEIETPSGKKSLYRIYRDTRFSKDKTPYKKHFSGHLRRATKYNRGGYYFHIEPDKTMIGGGFWGPNAADLLHVRKQIAQEPERLEEIVNSKQFIDAFGQLGGEQLKKAPKGFSVDDPAIHWLRYKQYLLSHIFTDQQVMQPDFASRMAEQFNNMRPFFDYMSEILTTDLNGEELLV